LQRFLGRDIMLERKGPFDMAMLLQT
jgi:hypothetical protein